MGPEKKKPDMWRIFKGAKWSRTFYILGIVFFGLLVGSIILGIPVTMAVQHYRTGEFIFVVDDDYGEALCKGAPDNSVWFVAGGQCLQFERGSRAGAGYVVILKCRLHEIDNLYSFLEDTIPMSWGIGRYSPMGRVDYKLWEACDKYWPGKVYQFLRDGTFSAEFYERLSD